MNKVLTGVLAAALLALGGSGYLHHRATEKVGSLNAKVSTLEKAVLDANREVERRDAVAQLFDRLIIKLDADKKVNQQQFAKVENAIRNIKPTEGDSDESLACLNTAVPAGLDSVLRDNATIQP